MTVKDLIDHLATLPPETAVCFNVDGDYVALTETQFIASREHVERWVIDGAEQQKQLELVTPLPVFLLAFSHLSDAGLHA